MKSDTLIVDHTDFLNYLKSLKTALSTGDRDLDRLKRYIANSLKELLARREKVATRSAGDSSGESATSDSDSPELPEATAKSNGGSA